MRNGRASFRSARAQRGASKTLAVRVVERRDANLQPTDSEQQLQGSFQDLSVLTARLQTLRTSKTNLVDVAHTLRHQAVW